MFLSRRTRISNRLAYEPLSLWWWSLAALGFRKRASNKQERNCWALPPGPDSSVKFVAVVVEGLERNFEVEGVDSCSVAQALALAAENCWAEQEPDSSCLAAADNSLRPVAAAAPDNCSNIDCYWPYTVASVAVDSADSRTPRMCRCAPSCLAPRGFVISEHSTSCLI